MSIKMKQLYINRIMNEHKIQLQRKIDLNSLQGSSIQDKSSSKVRFEPIIINTTTIFEDLRYNKLKGCVCYTDTKDNECCQLCFFKILSLHPEYRYTKQRLDKLIEFTDNGGDILSLPRGYSYCKEKLSQK